MALGIEEKDLEERFIRARGRGGQKVNTSSSCVQLSHRPTGIEVKCQQSRSQAMNRFFARRILADKVEALRGGETAQVLQERTRIRKQKDRRQRRARSRNVLPEDQGHD